MNLESFENEIARLESQLQDAIVALRALKDIQATFKDMQPRYERLKQLTDEAAGLPGHYAKQFETARKQAETRLAQLEAQFQQQQADWQITVTQYQQAHSELQQQLKSQQIALDTLSIQQQQDQATFQHHIEQTKTTLQESITILAEQGSLANIQLREFMEQENSKFAIELRQEIQKRFNYTLFIGLLSLTVALGTLAVALLQRF
jgi:DNA repair exonuclease SbcCD ATPase subunit